MTVDLTKYQEFVLGITSKDSADTDNFVARLQELQDSTPAMNPSLLNTCAIGLPAEAGEFADIVKKVLFHGKQYDASVRDHMAKELGDVMWYFANACTAIGVNPYDIIQTNIDKLVSRYPGGKFDASLSNTRKEGDI